MSSRSTRLRQHSDASDGKISKVDRGRGAPAVVGGKMRKKMGEA